MVRDDGESTIDCIEQLTYLLFLKMAHEQEHRALKPEQIVPPDCSWQRLLDSDGDQLELTYRHILEALAKQPGTLGVIFRKAQNKIQDPAKLQRLIVDLIDTQNWSAAGCRGSCVRGIARQGRGGREVRSGAVLHTTGADRCDGGLRATDSRRHGR